LKAFCIQERKKESESIQESETCFLHTPPSDDNEQKMKRENAPKKKRKKNRIEKNDFLTQKTTDVFSLEMMTINDMYR
jgi:hypothetical protein